MHLQAQPGSFCKRSVTFFNDLQDNKLEIAASELRRVYTFWNNCNGTLHAILMHESAAPNTSAKLWEELWWGEVNCDLKPCPLRRQREISYCISMKDLNISSLCNKYSLFSSHNYTYLHFSAMSCPRLKVTKDKEFHLHVFSHLSTTEMERGREKHLLYLHVCLCVSVTGGNKPNQGINDSFQHHITTHMIDILTAHSVHSIQREHFSPICMQVTLPVWWPSLCSIHHSWSLKQGAFYSLLFMPTFGTILGCFHTWILRTSHSKLCNEIT